MKISRIVTAEFWFKSTIKRLNTLSYDVPFTAVAEQFTTFKLLSLSPYPVTEELQNSQYVSFFDIKVGWGRLNRS